jgi:stage II sporulation protein D
LPASVLSKGKDLDLKSNDFRIKMGAGAVKSTLFRIRETGNGVELVGRGFGHGVGMSQWGANRMAQKGYTCKEILERSDWEKVCRKIRFCAFWANPY